MQHRVLYLGWRATSFSSSAPCANCSSTQRTCTRSTARARPESLPPRRGPSCTRCRTAFWGICCNALRVLARRRRLAVEAACERATWRRSHLALAAVGAPAGLAPRAAELTLHTQPITDHFVTSPQGAWDALSCRGVPRLAKPLRASPCLAACVLRMHVCRHSSDGSSQRRSQRHAMPDRSKWSIRPGDEELEFQDFKWRCSASALQPRAGSRRVHRAAPCTNVTSCRSWRLCAAARLRGPIGQAGP